MALVGVEFETLVSEPDALTIRPKLTKFFCNLKNVQTGPIQFLFNSSNFCFLLA